MVKLILLLKKLIIFIYFIILINIFYSSYFAKHYIIYNDTNTPYLSNISKEFSNQNNIQKEKKNLIDFLSNNIKERLEEISSIYLDYKCNFGNQLILLNKAIFFCEILNCKRIILNKKIYWFIKNKIIYKKYNMIIEVGEESQYKNENLLIDKSSNIFWYFNLIFPHFRMEIIKEEILNNLPNIKVDQNELYIYIRSGDIFARFIKRYKRYKEPPLCFYKNILKHFQFQNIYIIAENNNNPIIDKLLFLFPNIKYVKNNLKKDISILAHAFNIVGAYSTFIKTILLLNDNIISFWYFDFQVDLRYSYFFSFEFNHKIKNLYKMNSSDYYEKLGRCNNSENRANIMINYICKYDIKRVINDTIVDSLN